MRLRSLFAFCLWLIACNPQPDTHESPIEATANPWINSYTSGIISRTDPIAVTFQADEAGWVLPDQLPKRAFELSPSAAGRLEREGDYMLVYYPDEWLPPNTVFTATVHLDRLGLPAKGAEATFSFSFQTRQLNWHLASVQLEPAENDLMRLSGDVVTTDAVDASTVERALTVRYEGQELAPEWTHANDFMLHQFAIQGIERGKEPATLEIALQPPDGKARTRRLEVPEKGHFAVAGLEVVRSRPPWVEVRFTNPLDPDQPLAGLVRLGDELDVDLMREGATLKIFPRTQVMGEVALRIDGALRDANGKNLGSVFRQYVRFETPRPAVELVTDGIIMPGADKTILPFRAIMLRGVVVEVFRIHSHNVLQFLQENSLRESYNLNYVGRIVAQKEIELLDEGSLASAAQWKRYALDLSELIEPDPNAIYEVRIGFLPQHSLYPCDEPLEPWYLPEPVDGEYESITNWWNGPFGWYEGYDWDDREQPCKPAYFHSDRFIRTHVLYSNIGLIAKRGRDGRLTVIATDLRTAAPLAGATIEILDLQQSVLATLKTDANGMASARTERKPWFVRATFGDDAGYLRLHEGESLQMSRFDVSGQGSPGGLKGFIYGERGVWRPGDSLFLHFMLDDRRHPLPDDFPLKAELRDPRGRIAWQGVLSRHVDRIYPLRLATQPDDPAGLWRLTIRAGTARFRKNLRIEAIKPNRLKVTLAAGDEPLGIWQEPHRIALDVRWLHGTPARQARVVVELAMRDRAPSFEGFHNFRFFDPTCRNEPRQETLFDGITNDEGKASFTHTFAQADNLLAGMLDLDFRIRAFEPGGNFSIVSISKPYHPRTAYAGIRIPENEYGWKYFSADSKVPIEVVALSAEGKPLPHRRLELGVYQVGRYWWSEDYDELSRFASADHRSAFRTATLTTDQRGRATWTLDTDVSGRLLVRVCDPESGHCTGDFLYLSSWQFEEQTSKEEAAMMVFGTDKKEYAPGETVQVTVPAPEQGRILISLENGSGVLKTFWHEAQRGDNHITFEATPDMAPTTYVSAMLIQPHQQTTADLPMRLYGVVPITVNDPATVLEPEIALPQTLRPEQTATIRVSEARGRAMAYTLAVVDEGLLDLTSFRTPDPHAAFYAREALGVTTWDLYDDVAGAWNGRFDRVLAIGGDGDLKPPSAKARANRFEPMVRVLGPYHLDPGKTATHQIDIPNYIGSVRVMVVAGNGQGAYGHAEATRPVRKPLMVLGTLPRVLGPGEKLQLPVTVFAMEDKVKNVTVTVRESSGLARLLRSRQSFAVKAPEERTIYFPVELAADRTGVMRFTIEASAKGEKASHHIEIALRNPLHHQMQVTRLRLEPGQREELAYEPLGLAGTRSATLELSTLPPLDFGRLSTMLITYPYGCAEQIASAGMAQLLLPQMATLSEDQAAQCRIGVDAAINRLGKMQLPSGAFALWPGTTHLNAWADLWAGHFLIEARRQGMAVPPFLLDRWLSHAARDAAGAAQDLPLTRAYRLYLLALAGKADLSAMNYLRQQPQLDPLVRARLAAAYALAGQRAAAEDLLAGVQPVTTHQASSWWGYIYGSELRDLACYLEAFAQAERKTEAWESWQKLADAMADSRWVSTQDAAWAMLAAARFLEKWPPAKGDAQCRIRWQGQDQTIGIERGAFLLALPDEPQTIALTNTGSEPLFVRLVRQGQPAPGQEQPVSRAIRVAHTFTDEAGNTLQPDRLPQGTSFYCHTTVTFTGSLPFSLSDLALEQVFPSGWEILPDAHEGLSRGSATVLFRDKRDDRVQTFFTNWSGYQKNPNTALTFTVRVQATYEGRFYLPGPYCSGMYNGEIEARAPGQWVEVVPADQVQ